MTLICFPAEVRYKKAHLWFKLSEVGNHSQGVNVSAYGFLRNRGRFHQVILTEKSDSKKEENSKFVSLYDAFKNIKSVDQSAIDLWDKLQAMRIILFKSSTIRSVTLNIPALSTTEGLELVN
ncbi:hypothetical protein QAD02_012587 [Eretmocerus hayati]|uniref:Uncharacterized protein n=1 Tax=Eretmocerus hayati TaxID=131215 RepID=A0ACC2P4V1_9HYME|nr:hypothetical protein QAD02_012587 [Eretmocerus hayati]